MTGSMNCTTTSPIELQSLALRVVGSEHHGRVLRIHAPKCTIGSAAGCTLRLKASGVRDVHCLVLRGPGGLVVRSWSPDTRLNGQTVTDAPLHIGDRLAVGPIELEVLNPASLDQLVENSPLGAIDNGRLTRLEQKAREAARARDELAGRLAQRDEHVAQLEERLATTQQLIDQLQVESQAHSGPKTAPDAATLAEIESLKQQAETLAQQFEVARHSFAAERDTWQRERQHLQQQVEEAQNQIQLLTHGIEQARADITQKQTAWDHQHAHLIADLERARQQNATHVEQQREAREAEVAITHWRERAEELAQQIEELQNTHQDAASEHLKLRAELEAGARELDAETERLFEREEALAAQLQEFEAEYERASIELETRQQQLEALRIDLETRQAALEAHTPVETSSDDALEAQSEEITSLQQQLVNLQAISEQQASELEQCRAELDARAQQLEALQIDLEARQAALEAHAPVETSPDETLEAQAAEIAALQQQLADLQANYQQQASEWEQRCAELDERASALDRQAEELRLEAERLAAEERELQCQREAASELSTHDDQPPEQDAAETADYVPQSAADIIARLNASGLWKDDEVAIDEPPAEPAMPEPVWKSLVTEEPRPALVAAHDEEDSIEAYMQRLLKRVSGENESRPHSSPAKPSLPIVSPVVRETPAEKPTIAAEPHVEPFDPSTYVPRSMAPEASSKLAAMRELANSSARSAIHTSTKRRHAKHLSGKLGMSIFAVAAAISLGWLALQTHSTLSYYAAIGACVAGLLWGLHAGYLWLRKSRHVVEERTIEDAKEAGPVVAAESPAEADAQLVEAEASHVDEVAEPTAEETSQAI